jgi:hypothetical protein
MHSPARRRLIKGLAALAPLPFVARRFHGFAVADLDPVLLRALGAGVLPGELGSEGVARVVAGFARWLAGYREGAELLHGYGSGEIRRTGPSPALRWAGQLRELDQAARKAGGKPFAALDIPARQDLVRAALEGVKLAGLPPVDRAPHVAVGLLAFFYGSPEAADLCYGARIGRESCRPLDQSPRMPPPKAGGR